MTVSDMLNACVIFTSYYVLVEEGDLKLRTPHIIHLIIFTKQFLDLQFPIT